MSQSMSQTTTDLTVNEAFQQALVLQNEKKISEAIASYQKILDLGQAANSELTREQASAVSHNLSILYSQKNEAALSYVYNQKAIFLDEKNSAATEFLKQSKNTFKTAPIPRDIGTIENLNSIGLKYISVELLFVIVAALMIVVFRSFFQFILERKKADVLNTDPPTFKLVNYVWIFLMVISSLLLSAKIIDATELKAILKSPTASVQTIPGENQAVIAQAEIGTIFNVLKVSNDADLAYIQIKYPGAYSGWLKRSDLELLNSTHWPVFIDKK